MDYHPWLTQLIQISHPSIEKGYPSIYLPNVQDNVAIYNEKLRMQADIKPFFTSIQAQHYLW